MEGRSEQPRLCDALWPSATLNASRSRGTQVNSDVVSASEVGASSSSAHDEKRDSRDFQYPESVYAATASERHAMSFSQRCELVSR